MIFKFYSDRNRDIAEESEVYIYDRFPCEFRNQFLINILEVCKVIQTSCAKPIMTIFKCFAKEAGLDLYFDLQNEAISWQLLKKYVNSCSDMDFLNLLEFVFNLFIYNKFLCDYSNNNNVIFESSILDLNDRFKQHHLGYEFTNGMIIKKTNEVTHETIVKPALKLLCDEEFKGAEDEYLKALKFFRNVENEEAIMNAAKAFESFMKILCSKMHYTFDKETDTAQKLLERLKNNNFFPSYLNDQLNNLVKLLSSGAPTVRNKTAGHGQGEECRTVPDDYATYVMNLVASNIVFLHSIYKEHHSGK